MSIDQQVTRKSRVWMLAVFFPLTFGTFRYFPGVGALYEFWFIVCAAYLLGGFALWNRRESRKVTVGEWYIIALAGLVPVISAIAAWSAFGQPLIYGILAQRKLAVLAAVPVLRTIPAKGNIHTPRVSRSSAGPRLGYVCSEYLDSSLVRACELCRCSGNWVYQWDRARSIFSSPG